MPLVRRTNERPRRPGLSGLWHVDALAG